MRFLFQVLLLMVVSVASLYADVSEYKQIADERNTAFQKKMTKVIKARVDTASPEVQKIYREIGYRPVWVDADGVSHFGLHLLGEIKDDFDNGALLSLKPKYDALQKEIDGLPLEATPAEKAPIEMGIMQLYVDHIDAILKGSRTMLTPEMLLKESLKEGSLVHSFNTIAKERIAKRIPVLAENETVLGPQTILDENITKALQKGTREERLKAMYRLIHYQPVWVGMKGYSSFAKTLFAKIASDEVFDHHGPTYKAYKHLVDLPVPKTKQEAVQREFEVAKLYQDYMGYLLYGAIDWKRFQQEMRKHSRHGVWDVHEVLLTPEMLLVEAIKHKDMKYAFALLKPEYPGYDPLVGALVRYRKIAEAGGWPTLPEFKDLKPGMQSDVVPMLRERLRIEGDYSPCEGVDANSTLYDDCLLKAVKRFQSRHGLSAEGYIGKLTREALAETARHKYVRLRLNLARLKWLKRDKERYHIYANIPDFTITVFDRWKPVQKMRVVTGRKGHETPIFYNRVKRIVLNPYWRIPASIIRHETLPKLKRDPGYTNRKHIEIHTGYSEHSPRVNPYKVNWHKYGKRLPPYRFMQSPGIFNALGKVKFLFPNRYAVYMHDTPEKALFARDIRAFSHGCVRLEKPFDMLKTFSVIDPKIDYEKCQAILKKNKNTPIRLTKSVPIDIIYLTAWVDGEGNVEFREDIYGYDKLQIETAKWLPSTTVREGD